MLAVCSDCHSENFAKAELAKGDDMIREADHLLAEAIREVAGLYADGTLAKVAGVEDPARIARIDVRGSELTVEGEHGASRTVPIDPTALTSHASFA